MKEVQNLLDGIYEGDNFEIVATKLRSITESDDCVGKRTSRFIKFSRNCSFKREYLVFDQDSEDFIGKNRREKVKDRILVKKAGKRVVFWVLTVIHQ